MRQLRSYPTIDVLVVDKAEGGEVEVPLTDDYVEEVDAAGGVVKLRHLDEL